MEDDGEDELISSNVVLTLDRLEKEIEFFGNAVEFCYDVETIPSRSGADDRGVPSHNQVLWVGLATDGRAIQIPLGHPIGTKIIGEAKEPRMFKDGKIRMFKVPVYEKPPEQLTRADAFPLLNKLFADDTLVKAAHGATFDNASVAKYRNGLIPAGKIPCTIVMRWLCEEDRKRYGLKWITKDVYNFIYDDEEVGKQVEKYPFNMVGHYLHCDVTYTWLEYARNKKRIQEEGLWELFELETQLTAVLSEMRTHGVRIDEDRLVDMQGELGDLVQEIEKRAYAAAGQKFNIHATRAKQEILFKSKQNGGQGLKAWKMTDGGRKLKEHGAVPDHTFYSTDEESLSDFKGNPVVDAILDYQETTKILSTYVDGYLGVEDDKEKPNRIFDGHIYPDFVQYGAATGRFSCRNPNLQNVPRADTDLGKMVRSMFIPDPGYKLIAADYNQIELVFLAHFIGYGAFYDGFMQGIDPHTMTAAMALGKDPADVTKNERQRFGKSINFAVVFGAGITKLASMMQVPINSAKEFKDTYDRNAPEVEEFRRYVIKEARRQRPPHVTTLLGRKRRLPMVNSNDEGLRKYAERQLFNAKIQGSSADLTKMAMVRFHQMKKPGWHLLLTIHDELVVTAPEDEAEDCKAVLVEAMTGDEVQRLVSLPLKVEPAIAGNWADAK